MGSLAQCVRTNSNLRIRDSSDLSGFRPNGVHLRTPSLLLRLGHNPINLSMQQRRLTNKIPFSFELQLWNSD